MRCYYGAARGQRCASAAEHGRTSCAAHVDAARNDVDVFFRNLDDNNMFAKMALWRTPDALVARAEDARDYVCIGLTYASDWGRGDWLFFGTRDERRQLGDEVERYNAQIRRLFDNPRYGRWSASFWLRAHDVATHCIDFDEALDEREPPEARGHGAICIYRHGAPNPNGCLDELAHLISGPLDEVFAPCFEHEVLPITQRLMDRSNADQPSRVALLDDIVAAHSRNASAPARPRRAAAMK